MSDKTLYERLGGYDAIAAVAGDPERNDLLKFIDSTKAEIVE